MPLMSTLCFHGFILLQMLSVPQIYRIGTMFWDDKYGTHGLSPEVMGFNTIMLCYLDTEIANICKADR